MHTLGIDIGQADFSVRLLREDASGAPLALGEVRTFANKPAGYRALLAWLTSSAVELAGLRVVLEATGVYWEACAHCLFEQGCSVSVINPAQISYFARSRLRRGKTDALDADVIARFGAAMRPRAWQPPDAALEALKAMMRQREALVAMLTEEKNRQHAHRARAKAPAALLGFTQAHLGFLERQLAALEALIEEALAASAHQAEVARMQSVPGIGFVTSLTLLTETAAFAAMHHPKQLAAYAGLSPAPHQSGSLAKPSRISKIGNPRVRKAAYLAAVSAIKTDSPLRDFYQRLRAAGKPAKPALVAVARKLLTIAFAVVKSGQPYDPARLVSRPQGA